MKYHKKNNEISSKGHWDAFWEKGNLLYNEKIVKMINSTINLNGARILEVGAGSGATSIYLASKGANVFALDYSENAVELIKKNNKENFDIKIILADAFSLPFKDNSFDLVFSQELIEHYKEPELLLLEQKRVTKKGGYVLVDVPQRYNLYTLRKKILIKLNKWFAGWETSYSIKSLEKLLKNVGLVPVKKYAYSHIHNIDRIQKRILGRIILPSFVSKFYNKFWEIFEEIPLSHYTLFAIGIIAKKI